MHINLQNIDKMHGKIQECGWIRWVMYSYRSTKKGLHVFFHRLRALVLTLVHAKNFTMKGG